MLSPGPDMFLVMRNTLVLGRRQGAFTSIGILTGNLVHIAYCALGVAVLLQTNRTAYNVLRAASAIYLVYLGIQCFRRRETGESSTEPAVASARSAYWQGLFNNLLNPKGSLFYLGVFTQLITPDTSIPQTMILVLVMMTISAVFWVLFVYALKAPLVGRNLSRFGVVIDRALGVMLILLAARVAMLD
jgi:threonine/homoserine/homoserine lactone efflux protein